MKITLNLSTMPSVRERYALVWGVPTGVIGLAVLVLLSMVAVRNFREYRAVRRSVGELQRVEAQVHEQEVALRRSLEQPQLRDMYRQARFINTVIERKQFSATEVLQKVAPLLPEDARLTAMSLKHSGKDLEVRFAVVGSSDEALEQFLTNLEDSADFADVAILNQGFAPEGTENELMTLACSARYAGKSAP
jgi:hypothetical protein